MWWLPRVRLGRHARSRPLLDESRVKAGDAKSDVVRKSLLNVLLDLVRTQWSLRVAWCWKLVRA